MIGVILAAGKGTRFGDQTRDINKCLLKIKEKPILVYSLENMAKTKLIKKCIIVIGYKGEEIKKNVGNCVNGMQVKYCIQTTGRGIVAALECACTMIKDEDVFLMLGDEYVHQNKYQEALERFHSNKMSCLIGIKKEGNVNIIKKNYTFQFSKVGTLHSFIEKPDNPFNDYVGTGNIIFRKNVLKLLHKVPESARNQERELVGFLNLVVKENIDIYHFIVGSQYFNVNTVGDLNKLKQLLEKG